MKIQTTPIKIYSNNKNITVCGRKQQNSQPYVINNSPSFKSGVGDIKGTFDALGNKLFNVGKMAGDKIGSLIQKAENCGDRLYDWFVKRTSSAEPVVKVKKNTAPAVRFSSETGMPLPSFSMDYDSILKDLETIKTIDEKWLRNNKNVLKAANSINNVPEDQRYIYRMMANSMNDEREFYINLVKKLQAEEKAEYIKSIWNEYIHVNPPYKPINKEKNLLGLKALQSYGTREDMLKLHDVYQLSKDSDIMREYAKLVGKVGEPIDVILIWSYTDSKYLKIYTEETMAEIMKSIKKLMVDKSEPGKWKEFDYMHYKDFEELEKHKNKTISENAKAIMDRLIQDNPWLLE